MASIIEKIPISYKSDEAFVNFDISFGKGHDSRLVQNEYTRTNFDKNYDIELFENDGVKMYRIIAHEGVFVMRVDNINVSGLNENPKYNYRYGIRIVVDLNHEPKYSNSINHIPFNNIERDGGAWDLENGKAFHIDQNSNAKFQWSTAKALEKNVEPTKEQEEMGVEKRHKSTGLIYITCIPIMKKQLKEEYNIPKEQPQYRGGSGEAQFRGGSSHAARVGYGSRATTKTEYSDFAAIYNSKYILPLRFRISTEGVSDKPVNCARNLEYAQKIEDLQNNTAVMDDDED